MGFLDEVISAALGSKAQSAQPQSGQAQPQAAPGQPAQDPLSQIATALTALLAPRSGAASTAPGAAGQQGSLGGLDVLINQFKQNGFEDVINSWIGTGRNQPISPTQLRQALGPETVNRISGQAGAPQEDLLSQLSKYLPGVIDRLTPGGQLPNDPELRSGDQAGSTRA